MIAKDIDHGSHGLFPRAVAAGRFLVILLFSGLFDPDFALIGGVHAPHEVVLKPMKRLPKSLISAPLYFISEEMSSCTALAFSSSARATNNAPLSLRLTCSSSSFSNYRGCFYTTALFPAFSY